MAHPFLKSNVNKGNYESPEEEKEPLLPAVPTFQVNAEVRAVEVYDIQSSKIRDDSQNYDSQTSSNDTFETAAKSSAENIHSDISSTKTAYETIEIDKNYDDSTTTTEGRSTRSFLEFENMDEQYRIKHSSVIQGSRSGIRDTYNFMSKVRGDSEMQSTYDSSIGNFMVTKQGLAENVQSDDILSRPSTSKVDERAGVKWSNYNSPPKSGDEISTGSFISFLSTIASKNIEEVGDSNSLGSNANEIMEIQVSESSSGDDRVPIPISRRESPCHEQHAEVSRNESRQPNAVEQHMEQDNSFASLEEPVASHVKKSLQEEAVKMKVRDERRQNWIEESKILAQRMKSYESLEESRKLEQERKSRERRLLKLVQQREKFGRIEDEEQELGQRVKSHEAKELGSEHKLQPRQKGRNFPDGLQQGEQTGLTMNERLKRERQQEKARKDRKPHGTRGSNFGKETPMPPPTCTSDLKTVSVNADYMTSTSFKPKRRQTLHSKERKFACMEDGCSDSFAYKHVLLNHQKGKHRDIYKIPCDYAFCTRVFKTKECKDEHFEAKHKKRTSTKF